jgi:hypothetical protein
MPASTRYEQPKLLNQAMHALVFLDTRVLTHAMQGRITAVRADKQITVPVVMTREAVAAVLSRMDGTAPNVLCGDLR